MNKRCLIINKDKAPDVIQWVKSGKISTIKKITIPEIISNKIDRIDVAGGDGTFLGAIRRHWEKQIPFFGINRGTEGFLLNPIDSVDEYIASFDSFKPISLNLLDAKFILTNGDEVRYVAFNDVFFVNMIPNGCCRGIVKCHNDFEADFNGNGIIVATPQGSTAYNKAAGGDIMSLRDNVLAITTICGFSKPVQEISIANEVEIEFHHGKLDGVADNEPVPNVKKAFISVIPNAVQIAFLSNYNFDLERYRMASKMKRGGNIRYY